MYHSHQIKTTICCIITVSFILLVKYISLRLTIESCTPGWIVAVLYACFCCAIDPHCKMRQNSEQQIGKGFNNFGIFTALLCLE